MSKKIIALIPFGKSLFLSLSIASSIGLNEEKINLAKLIGLLHDIARFEQYTRYQTFRDIESIDHGNLGAEILQQDNSCKIRRKRND